MSNQILKKLVEHDRRFEKLESDVSELKGGVKELKGDVKMLKTGVAQLQEDSHKNGILFEEHKAKLDQVLEIVLHTQRNSMPRQEIIDRFDGLDNRVSALEHFARKNW